MIGDEGDAEASTGLGGRARWRARAAEIEAQGLRRRLRAQVPVDATRALIAGEDRVYDVFSSNDYLGLAAHPEVEAAMASGGAGAARLIAGNRRGHDALEAQLSEWLGRPATLFGSGYLANLAVFTALYGEGDMIASDAYNHASIIDGLRLSRCARRVVTHGASELPDEATAVVVEGLYSMDGDVPPFDRLQSALRGRTLVVDEAHALGCLGPEGRGVAAGEGVTPDIVVGTLGKAFGAAGAFVVGPPEVREILISSARPFIYTTALPEGVALAASVGVRLATAERRERLAANTARLRAGLQDLGIDALGVAHIVPIVTGARTMALAGELLEAGFLVGAVRYPTVARGSERLRITLSAEHSNEQIDRLLTAVSSACTKTDDVAFDTSARRDV